MRKIIFFLFIPFLLNAQDGAHRYFISFNNKLNTNFSLNQPEDYLSEKAISKRIQFEIPIDSLDLPVSNYYLDKISLHGFSVENKSKWLNGVIVSTYDSLLIESVNYSFIDSIIYFGSWSNNSKMDNKWDKFKNIYDFGFSENQLKMLGGDLLHSYGYKGSGIVIAVIDAGFYNVDKLDAFNDLRNQILSSYDFVDGNIDVFNDHTHGTLVLSTMGGYGDFVGSAPNAEYILLRSEDVFSENLIEEYLWVCAAEFADSSGADIINSSLGYTTFDNEIQNHTYEDMDGETTPVSVGAGIASKKGIIVINSAGNSGDNDWYYISAPADNIDVITVGAVNSEKKHADFSSFGPNADGFIKPNVMAQGEGTFVINSENQLVTANGTSFSAPLISGMTACLWGGNKNSTSKHIKQAIFSSADRYNDPNNIYGFGIPHYYSAHQRLNYDFTIPVNISLNGDVNFFIFNIEGKLINSGILYFSNTTNYEVKIYKPKEPGFYLINLVGANFNLSKKFIVAD